jgi:hypothetical protein
VNGTSQPDLSVFEPAINRASLQLFVLPHKPATARLPATGQRAKKTIKAAPHGSSETLNSLQFRELAPWTGACTKRQTLAVIEAGVA